ncbi:hypothetical protein BDF14DRAFT_1824254 [Spinellus fusiger]|nr:hypothetical protein BDF14DRAFT_1824254 [Spinellus fusiger]
MKNNSYRTYNQKRVEVDINPKDRNSIPYSVFIGTSKYSVVYDVSAKDNKYKNMFLTTVYEAFPKERILDLTFASTNGRDLAEIHFSDQDLCEYACQAPLIVNGDIIYAFPTISSVDKVLEIGLDDFPFRSYDMIARNIISRLIQYGSVVKIVVYEDKRVFYGYGYIHLAVSKDCATYDEDTLARNIAEIFTKKENAWF